MTSAIWNILLKKYLCVLLNILHATVASVINVSWKQGIFQEFFEKLKKKKMFQSNIGNQLVHHFSANRNLELLGTWPVVKRAVVWWCLVGLLTALPIYGSPLWLLGRCKGLGLCVLPNLRSNYGRHFGSSFLLNRNICCITKHEPYLS